ncbi:unnamed protein product [Closterium sp. NIES-54]
MSGTLIGQELEPSLLVDVELHSPRDPELHPSQHAHQQQLGGKMEYNYLQRVKVYRLNDDGKWDDKGTGHVSVEYLERSDAIGLVVIDEEDNATLLVHRISTDDIYQRQEDTIISWTDPEVATDLALSFQESMGCAYIWDQICNVQRQIQLPSVLGTPVSVPSVLGMPVSVPSVLGTPVSVPSVLGTPVSVPSVLGTPVSVPSLIPPLPLPSPPWSHLLVPLPLSLPPTLPNPTPPCSNGGGKGLIGAASSGDPHTASHH